jgi:hypothetical protein
MRKVMIIAISAMLLMMTGCSGLNGTPADTTDTNEKRRLAVGQIGGGLTLGGADATNPVNSGLAVNGYLWRASLDTISFLPLAQADAFGGVIVTEWSSLPSAPNERYKLTVYILNRELRADGVRVSVFRQERSTSGEWVDAAVSDGVPARIENAILLRARQLRIDSQASLK